MRRLIIFGDFGSVARTESHDQQRFDNETFRHSCVVGKVVGLGASGVRCAGHSSVCALVYFLSSLRAQTARTLICTKSGVSAESRKSAKKCGKPHVLRTFYAKGAVSALFGTLSGLGGNPTFCGD